MTSFTCYFLCLPFKAHPAIRASCTRRLMEPEELSVVATVPPAVSSREMGAAIKTPLLLFWCSSWLLSFRQSQGLSTGWLRALSVLPGQAQGTDALSTLGDGMLDDWSRCFWWIPGGLSLSDWLARFPQALSSFMWCGYYETELFYDRLAGKHSWSAPPCRSSSLLQLPRSEKCWWSLTCGSEQVCSSWLTTIPRSQLPLEADPELKYCLAPLCGPAPSGIVHTTSLSSCAKQFFSKGLVELSKAG